MSAMGDDGPRIAVTPMFIALGFTSLVFLVAGVVGLASPDLAPALAPPAVAWSLIGVGVVLDGAALVTLFWLRR